MSGKQRALEHFRLYGVEGGFVGTTAALIAAGIGAAGSIAGGVLGSRAAKKAGETQAAAADRAAQLDKQKADEALALQREQLDFQKKIYGTEQENIAPWLAAGRGGLEELARMGGGAPWTGKFEAPTDVTEQNDPGFQFRLREGQKALERSASARGNLMGAGTQKALTRYGQGFASNEYGQVYARAASEYERKYNEFRQQQNKEWNRFASLAGVGQTALGELNTAGRNAVVGQGATTDAMGNIIIGSGRTIGDTMQSAAAARASGYMGAANAWSGALGGVANAGQNYALLRWLQSRTPAAPGTPHPPYPPSPDEGYPS